MTETLFAASGPILEVEEYQYGDDGVLLNGGEDLPFFDVRNIQGLDSAPGRVQTADREGTDGGYVDASWEQHRTITIEGTIYTHPSNQETYLDALKANFAIGGGTKPFYFMTDAGLRVAYGKSLGVTYNRDQMRRIGAAEASMQIMCEDPRFYSPEVIEGSTTLGTGTTTGRGYPKAYTFGYGSIATQNGVVITLSGNRKAPGLLVIEGPVINPSIIFDNTGSTLSLNFTLSASDTITIDLANKAVLLNGSGNARGYMTITGGWFMLEPGENSFRFLGTQSPPTPPARLTVSAQSSWR